MGAGTLAGQSTVTVEAGQPITRSHTANSTVSESVSVMGIKRIGVYPVTVAVLST